MNVSITNPNRRDSEPVAVIQLNTQPHNIRFSHVEHCNCLFVKLVHFPYKEIMNHLSSIEDGEVIQLKGYIRICIKKQYTTYYFVVRYGVRVGGASKNQYTVTEKERLYPIEAERVRLFNLTRAYLSRLYEFNTQRDADLLASYFKAFITPPTLEAISERLTEEERQRALRTLCAIFDFDPPITTNRPQSR